MASWSGCGPRRSESALEPGQRRHSSCASVSSPSEVPRVGLGELIESLCVKYGEECLAQGKGSVPACCDRHLLSGSRLLFTPVTLLSAQVSLKV